MAPVLATEAAEPARHDLHADEFIHDVSLGMLQSREGFLEWRRKVVVEEERLVRLVKAMHQNQRFDDLDGVFIFLVVTWRAHRFHVDEFEPRAFLIRRVAIDLPVRQVTIDVVPRSPDFLEQLPEHRFLMVIELLPLALHEFRRLRFSTEIKSSLHFNRNAIHRNEPFTLENRRQCRGITAYREDGTIRARAKQGRTSFSKWWPGNTGSG